MNEQTPIGARPARLALLGCGWHARAAHASPLADRAARFPERVQLVAACDLDRAKAEAVCADFGFARAYEDTETMLAEARPDAVVAVMPVPHIAAVATRLLERGVTCSIEKPLGASPAEVRALVETAARTGTPHMVSVNRRFNPYLRKAKEWFHRTHKTLPTQLWALMVRKDRREDSFLWVTGVHMVDACRFLVGDLRDIKTTYVVKEPNDLGGPTVWAYGINGNFGPPGDMREFYMEIDPTRGSLAECYTPFGGHGPAAFVSVQMPESMKLAVIGEEPEIDEADPSLPTWQRDGSAEETDAFIELVRGERAAESVPTVADVAPSVLLCWDIWENRPE